jgi:hypothetical protein
MDYAKFVEGICGGVEGLCGVTLSQYGTQVLQGVREFFDESKPRIEAWKADYDAGKMSKDDCAMAIKGRLAVASLAGLSQIAELQQELVDFKAKLYDLIGDALFGKQ